MERIQAAIVYDCICELEVDRQLQDSIDLAVIQAVHPILHQISVGLTSRQTSFNRHQTFSQLSKLLMLRCIQMLESMTGSEVPQDIATKVSSVKSRINNTVSRLNNLVQKYQRLVDKYAQEYLIPIKLHSDPRVVSYSCAQVQQLRFIHRRNHTFKIYEKFRSTEDVERLKKKWSLLQEKSKSLSDKITETKKELSKYSKCDNRLIVEYKKVKERLDEQKWAKSQLANNFSNLSFSD